jgi:aryl-alcohol dehydrogenase-like predicted oxidoreductase
MQKRKLGKDGPEVSVVGLGCNNFGALDVEKSRAVVHRALDAGINLFDTADVYGNRGGSESQLGEILGPRRKDIVLATKFGMPMDDAGEKTGASAKYIAQACEDSLKRLKTDWIDLYQLHRPDPKTPIEETLEAFNKLVKAGKVRHIGCSNMPAWQVADSQWVAKTKGYAAFATAQDEYSLINRDIERELTGALTHYGMGLLPYFPLASGLLTGKYKQGAAIPDGTRFARMGRFGERYMTEENWRIIGELEDFASSRGHTLLEAAFSWLIAQPFLTSVIAGATKPEQIDANVKAAGWVMTPDEVKAVHKITKKA